MLKEEAVMYFDFEKKLIFFFLLFFLASTLFLTHAAAEKVSTETVSVQPEAEHAEGKNPLQQRPQITIDVPNYDVGEIYEGEKISHNFTIKNTGTTDLNIKDVKAG